MQDWLVSLFFPSGAPAGVDLDDPEQCAGSALAAATADLPDAADGEASIEVALRRGVATLLLAGEPVVLLETAELMLSEGRRPGETWAALDLAFAAAIEAEDDPDRVTEVFCWNLEQLPLPTDEQIARAYRDLATSPMSLDDLDDAVADLLAMDLGIPMVRTALEAVQDEILTDRSLLLLPGDFVVRPESALADLVLTTRVQSTDRLVLGVDLAAFDLLPEPEQTATGEDVLAAVAADGRLVWQGPPGWLSGIAPGTLVAVRRDGPRVLVEHLAPDDEPAVDADLVAAVRAVYEQEVEEVGLPVSSDDLVVGLRAVDPDRFRRPAAPLTDLCAAAGLEIRGTVVGHGRQVWARRRWSRLLSHTYDVFGDEERPQVLELVRLVGALTDGEQPPDADVRAGLAALAEPDLTLELMRLLDDAYDAAAYGLGPDEPGGAEEDAEATADLAALTELLRPAATRARTRAAVNWLRSRVAARRNDPVQAEALLRDVLLDDPDNADVIDELAWYASDRGDVEKARSLWLQLEDPSPPDLEVLVESSPGGPKLRRNEPCWCGSGRKYKACHLRSSDQPPLPDRFPWMLRKLFAYFERSGNAAARDLDRAARLLGRHGEQAIEQVWSDPVALDTVLFEFGWLDRFLTARGELLPEDERLLYSAWQLGGRSLYEVTDVDPDAGTARLRDVRTGDEEEIHDRLFSTSTRRSSLVCVRLLDDGQAKQLCDGGFDVAVGRESSLLEVLDIDVAQERGEALLAWLAAASQPPRLQTREGEPLARCSARVGPVDPAEASELLDVEFEHVGDARWVERHRLTPDETIVRATLTLVGDEVLVETTSEVRLDRLLALLVEELPGVEIRQEEREPFSLDPSGGEPPPMLDLAGTGPGLGESERLAVLQSVVETQELRWCREPVAALSGLTPREAAADPTRREQLERLLASMPEGGVSPLGVATMRPARLREMLDLT